MIEINLIPDVKRELIHAHYIRNRVILGSIVTSIVSVAVVVLLAVYTYGAQTVINLSLDGSIEKEAKTLSATTDLTKILTIQSQLESITSLHESKNISSRFNDMINKINPPSPNSAKYSSVVVNADDKMVVIDGQTSGFPAYETFQKTLKSAVVKYNDAKDSDKEKDVPLASNVSIAETSFGVDSTGVQVLRFTITFNYADEFLSPLAKNAVVHISGSGNVTDSYQGVPQSLFVDKASDITEGQ